MPLLFCRMRICIGLFARAHAFICFAECKLYYACALITYIFILIAYCICTVEA